MNNQTETPRTNAQYYKPVPPQGDRPKTDYEIQLERELNEATDLLKHQIDQRHIEQDKLTQSQADCAAYRKELTRIAELRHHLHELEGGCAYIAEQALDSTTSGKELLERLEKAESKLAFLATKGLTVGMMKTLDKPKPYLVYIIQPDSELDDIKGVNKIIDLEQERDSLRAKLTEIETERDSLLARMDECGYQEMLAKQHELKAKLTELLGIAEVLNKAAFLNHNLASCGGKCALHIAESQLTTFKQGLK